MICHPELAGSAVWEADTLTSSRLRDFATSPAASTLTNRGLGLIDLALFVTAVILFLGDATILTFHIIFVLLTMGAFFWKLRAFAWRATFWVLVTTFGVLLDVLVGRIPSEELIELPLLSTILVGVFMIAQRRSEVQSQLLEQDQAFLGAVLENMEDAVVACDADGNLAFSNSRARLFHGLPTGDLPLGRWTNHYRLYATAGDEPIGKDEIPIFRVLSGARVRDEEFLITPTEGLSRVLLVSGNRMMNVAAAPIGAVVVMRDVTEPNKTARELKESEERFRATFEQAAVGVAHNALDGRWLRVNQRLCDIVGYSREEFLDTTFQDITHPEDLETDLEYTRRLLAREIKTYSMDKRYLKKDGSTVWINLTVSLVCDPSEEPKYFIAVIEDISGRKRAEKEIAMRAQQGEIVASLGQRALATYDLYALMDESVSLIAQTLKVQCCGILELLSDEDELLLISGSGWVDDPTGETIMPCDPDSLAGYTLASSEPVIVEDLGAETRFESPSLFTDHGAVSGVSLPIRGQEHPFGILCAFTTESRTFTRDEIYFLQAVTNVLTSAYDRQVTDQRLYEVQSEERERIARDLHDTVLQEIARTLRVIEMGRPSAGEAQREVSLESVVNALRQAVRDLRNCIYDLRSEETSEQSFVWLVEHLIQQNREIAPKIDIDLNVEEGFPAELKQPTKTEVVRIIQEALANVRRHAGASRVRLHLRSGGGEVEAEITDNGRGFEPRSIRSGLGLRGMRERALRLGGNLEVRSELGEGTKVRFTAARSRLLDTDTDLHRGRRHELSEGHRAK
jgi:PAS domain S-box-containing protein